VKLRLTKVEYQTSAVFGYLESLCTCLIYKAMAISDSVSASKSVYSSGVLTDGVERRPNGRCCAFVQTEVWQEASTSARVIRREMDGKMHVGWMSATPMGSSRFDFERCPA
jgi:hypothetical protein